MINNIILSHGYSIGTAIAITTSWEYLIFLSAADCELLYLDFMYMYISQLNFHSPVVMILRVYAMWNQSKWILYFLLCIYGPQVIISLVFTSIFANPNTYLSGMSYPKLH